MIEMVEHNKQINRTKDTKKNHCYVCAQLSGSNQIDKKKFLMGFNYIYMCSSVYYIYFLHSWMYLRFNEQKTNMDKYVWRE